MKTEEIELKCGKYFAHQYSANECRAEAIARKEREMVSVLRWRLNPDTLFFWLDALMDRWDNMPEPQS